MISTSGCPLHLVAFAFALSGAVAGAQTSPRADHHAHLQSPTAARLLNEGVIPIQYTPQNHEKEKPQTAAELIAQLDAAGVRLSVAISDAIVLDLLPYMSRERPLP